MRACASMHLRWERRAACDLLPFVQLTSCVRANAGSDSQGPCNSELYGPAFLRRGLRSEVPPNVFHERPHFGDCFFECLIADPELLGPVLTFMFLADVDAVTIVVESFHAFGLSHARHPCHFIPLPVLLSGALSPVARSSCTA